MLPNHSNLTITSFRQKSSSSVQGNLLGNENIFSGNLLKKCTLWDNQNYNTTRVKLVYNCIKEEAKSNKETLPNDLHEKLSRILLINEAVKCKNFPKNSQNIPEPISFLGILDAAKCKLNSEEKSRIKYFVEAKLREKTLDFISRYNDLGGNVKDLLKNRDSVNSKICSQSNELVTANWTKKINEIYSTYMDNLNSFFELLNKWGECKITLNESRFKSTELTLIQAQLIETQTIITKLSCQLRMFLESPSTINSFRILKSNLDLKANQIDDEIQRKLILKKEYEDLKCTEYDDILKKYLDLCNAVKRKIIFLDKLEH